MQIDRKVLAKEWFDAADSDFSYAEVGLREEKVFPQVAFLSQQVVEKYLKGFLVLNGEKPLRIHDLPKLLDECVELKPELDSAFSMAKLVKETLGQWI